MEESEGGCGGNVGGEGWSGCNVGGEGGSGGSGGNVGGEGGERTEGGRGGAGGRGHGRYKNSKSSIPTLLFLYNMCPPSKHFYYHCLQYTEQIRFFTSNGDAKGGKLKLPLFAQA